MNVECPVQSTIDNRQLWGGSNDRLEIPSHIPMYIGIARCCYCRFRERARWNWLTVRASRSRAR